MRGQCLTTIAIALLGVGAAPVSAQTLAEDPFGAPLRVHDYTFGSFLALGFAPAPAAPLGVGRSAIEVHLSAVNDFQVSPAVETYLAQVRDGRREPLSAADIAAITALPTGEGYFIDTEVTILEIAAHWGLSPRVDFSISVPLVHYGGGFLDGLIYDFHDTFGYGQQGRESVADDQFQVVLGAAGEARLVRLEAPSAGIADPSLFIRYAVPAEPGGWRFNLAGGIKAPIAATEDLLSTGGWDVGVQATAERQLRRNAFLLNLAIMAPGDFELAAGSFDPPLLPSVHLAWIYRPRRTPRLRWVVQALAAEHLLRNAVDSDLARPEFQLTVGVKWNTGHGTLGFGITENLFNMDNTPDIGLHLTWGTLLGQGRNER